MAINYLRQIVTPRSPVTSGGVPPSGNFPVQSPFTGGFKPRVQMNGPNGAYGTNPTTATLKNNVVPSVGHRMGLHSQVKTPVSAPMQYSGSTVVFKGNASPMPMPVRNSNIKLKF